MNMAGAAAFGTPPECVRRALDAGCDMVLLCNCPGNIPDVIDSLDGYSDPAAQLRLMRLRARPGPDLKTLRSTPRWQHALDAVQRLDAPPDLKLEG
jgi:beta-N-acetylhexosaminidase